MKLILITLLIFSCLFVPLTTVSAEEMLLFDNFNDGNLDGWIVEGGNWFVNNGNLAGSKSGKNFGGRISRGDSEWENYMVELDFNIQQGIDIGVGFRHNPSVSGYELNLRAGTGIFDTPQIILRKAQDGVVSVVGDTHSFPLINNKWYHLKTEVNGENIRVWVDNIAIFDIKDTNTKVKNGKLTFAYNTGVIGVAFMRFDNVKVTKLQSADKIPLILIPGIGGSELKVNQDTFWLKDDGHGGEFNHAYSKDEKVWVNEGEAAKPGHDDYFDVLRMKEDGITSEADIGITGDVVDRAYKETVDFFISNGYTLDEDLFIFPYDWRKNISDTVLLLDQKIQQIKQQTESQKVDVVSHSMGGLVARNYIADPARAQNIRKLFTLGTPHLGAADAIKKLRYGDCLTPLPVSLGPICLGITNSEFYDVIQNMISLFQLIPSQTYFNFYSNEDNLHPYPYRTKDGSLNYLQIKNLLTALGHNSSLFTPAEFFHSFDSSLSETNGVEVVIIAGSGKSTVGQIIEKDGSKDILSVNGDDTVPILSASIADPSKQLFLNGPARVYYTNQKHGNLVSDGPALKLIRNILNGDNSLPTGVSDTPFKLEGKLLSVHSPVNIHIYDQNGNHTGPTADGDIEINIPGSLYDSLGDAKFIWLPDDGIYTVKFDSIGEGSFDFKIRQFEDDVNIQTVLYEDVPLTQNSQGQTVYDTSSFQPPVLQIDVDGDNVDDFSVDHFSILKDDANYDHDNPQISFDVNPRVIWPPSGKEVEITITGYIRDANPYLTSIAVDDEYDLVEPRIEDYYQSEFQKNIKLQASRKDDDLDGRKYLIRILAKDSAGNETQQQLEVIVPHDLGKR